MSWKEECGFERMVLHHAVREIDEREGIETGHGYQNSRWHLGFIVYMYEVSEKGKKKRRDKELFESLGDKIKLTSRALRRRGSSQPAL